jgi:hypothetical protein
MPPQSPPNSIWLLLESTADGMASTSIRDGHRSITLDVDRWHCLPGSWRKAVNELVDIHQRQGDYARFGLQVWDPLPPAPQA